MKRHRMALTALLVLLVSAGLAWWSAHRVNALAREREKVVVERKGSDLRLIGANQTEKRIEAANRCADDVAETLAWAPDSTVVLQWFADTAGLEGVVLDYTQVLPLRVDRDTMAEGRMVRTHYSLRIEGPFVNLVRYIERVEESPHVLVVEKFSMSAKRNYDDLGDLRLTVSALSPVARAREDGTGGEANRDD